MSYFMRFLHFTFWFGTDSLAPTNREFIMLTLIHDTLMPIIGLDKENTFRTPVSLILNSGSEPIPVIGSDHCEGNLQ